MSLCLIGLNGNVLPVLQRSSIWLMRPCHKKPGEHIVKAVLYGSCQMLFCRDTKWLLDLVIWFHLILFLYQQLLWIGPVNRLENSESRINVVSSSNKAEPSMLGETFEDAWCYTATLRVPPFICSNAHGNIDLPGRKAGKSKPKRSRRKGNFSSSPLKLDPFTYLI